MDTSWVPLNVTSQLNGCMRVFTTTLKGNSILSIPTNLRSNVRINRTLGTWYSELLALRTTYYSNVWIYFCQSITDLICRLCTAYLSKKKRLKNLFLPSDDNPWSVTSVCQLEITMFGHNLHKVYSCCGSSSILPHEQPLSKWTRVEFHSQLTSPKHIIWEYLRQHHTSINIGYIR